MTVNAIKMMTWLLMLTVNISVVIIYGVTCWEVFSCGKIPYPGVNTIDLPALLNEGVRLESPTNASTTTDM